VLDSLGQIDTLAATLERARPRPVVLRLNAASLVRAYQGRDRSADARVARGDHFGMDEQQLRVAIERLRGLGVGVRGIHVFAGSFTFRSLSMALCEALLDILPGVELALGGPLDFLNLGGGFPHDWDSDLLSLEHYRKSLEPLMARTHVHHEAGRAIFARAGVFVTTVTAIKSIDERSIVVCDGGIAHNFLLAQTESVFKRLRPPRIVPMGQAPAPILKGPIQVVGNSCSRADVIGEVDGSQPVACGDRLIFRECGAYSTYSLVGFLSLKAAHRYLVS
jgi:diaminopimelate decarboxylase